MEERGSAAVSHLHLFTPNILQVGDPDTDYILIPGKLGFFVSNHSDKTKQCESTYPSCFPWFQIRSLWLFAFVEQLVSPFQHCLTSVQ